MSELPPTPPMQAAQPTEVPEATPSLVLGILSIVFAGCAPAGVILGYIGMQKGKRGRQFIAQRPGQYSNAGIAQAGYVCSIVGLILSGISLAIWAIYMLIFVLALVGAAASSM